MPTRISQYVFGNSLVNYAEGGALTNVPHWLDYIAEQTGDSYAVGGEYGFLRDYAARPEPLAQWGFAGVEGSVEGSFDTADLTSVLITPANFIQADAPSTPYPGDTVSPLDATLEIIDDVQLAQPDARILIYQGWADMAPFLDSFPPSDAELADYHAYNLGAYTDWYEDFVQSINTADPDANVQIIPVAAVLSEMFTTILADVPVEALYVDDAPHGTETVYFLASLITYSAETGLPLPTDLIIPPEVHPAVATNYEAVASLIDMRVAEYVDAPAPDVADPVDDPADVTDGTDTTDVPDDTATPDETGGTDTPVEVVEDAPITVAPAPEPEDPADNLAPVTALDAAELSNNEALVLDVTSNDEDPDGGALELLSVGDALYGTVSIEDGLVTYVPDAGYVGQDSFVYFVSDGQGGISEGVVYVSVNAADDIGDAADPPPLEQEEAVEDTGPLDLPHTGSDPDPEPSVEPDAAPEPVPAPASEGSSPPSDTAPFALPSFLAKYYSVPDASDTVDDIDLGNAPVTEVAEVSLAGDVAGGQAWPDGPDADYGVRYIQDITIDIAGSYRFAISTDDPASLLIDGNELVRGETGPISGEIWLNEGQHNVEVRAIELTGEEDLDLLVEGPFLSDDEARTSAPEDAVADLMETLQKEPQWTEDAWKEVDIDDDDFVA